MGVHRNDEQKLKFHHFFLPTNKKFMNVSFFKLLKKSLKIICRTPHQSRSKDFNQIGETFYEKFGYNFESEFGCKLINKSTYNTRLLVCQNQSVFKVQRSLLYH